MLIIIQETYPTSAAIISKLIGKFEDNRKKKEVVEKIRKKFKKIPNTGYLDIWLQRIAIGFDEDISFEEPICQLVANRNNTPLILWKSDWLKIKQKIKENTIINEKELNKARGKDIQKEEVSNFPGSYY